MKYLFFWIPPIWFLTINVISVLIIMLISILIEAFYLLWYFRTHPEKPFVTNMINDFPKVNWTKEWIMDIEY